MAYENPCGSVGQLSRWLGISSRQLQRRFTVAVGYAPKTFQEVLRFQKLLGLAKTREQCGLAHLSVDAGYADQSHMGREVRRFSGARPTELLGSAECTLAASGALLKVNAAIGQQPPGWVPGYFPGEPVGICKIA